LVAGRVIIDHRFDDCEAPSTGPVNECPTCDKRHRLLACAEFLAELVRSDQVQPDEQTDEARALLEAAGVEV
jgi:hypothetical protein